MGQVTVFKLGNIGNPCCPCGSTPPPQPCTLGCEPPTTPLTVTLSNPAADCTITQGCEPTQVFNVTVGEGGGTEVGICEGGSVIFSLFCQDNALAVQIVNSGSEELACGTSGLAPCPGAHCITIADFTCDPFMVVLSLNENCICYQTVTITS
jgi:hypothetical protein